ncbi:MAG: acetolactate synthase [Methanomassiliicoccaceae archaeon]|jgi:acetolactate synthase-1/3 small subunit|nr:acetolactate synthase [Methanomassiliicoccaceae archaeon]
MYVISLVVKNEFGVMQRVMGEFTRNKINVETIVVGKCEQPGKSRMVLSVIDKNDAVTAMGRLEKLQDIYESELVTEEGQSAYALLSTSKGNVGVVGSSDQVDEIIEMSAPDKYVSALNAL